MSARRVVVGFVIAPAVPALVVLALQAGAIAQGRAEWGTSLFAVLGYATAAVVGVPAFLLLRRRRARSFANSAAFGSFIGVVPACVLFLPEIVAVWADRHEQTVLLLGNLSRAVLGGAVLGCVSAVVFWLIAIRTE